FIQAIRKAGVKAHINLGGFCASAIPEKILSYTPLIDSVICGEGELSIVDLSRMVIYRESNVPKGIYLRRDAQILFGGVRPLIENLDELPFPIIDNFTVDKSKNFSADYHMENMMFIASRGCYGRCIFCSIQRFYRSCPGKVWRARSPQKVVKEISICKQSTGLNRFTFVDENFLGPGQLGRNHALAIAKELQKEQMALLFNFGCRPNDLHKDTLMELKKAGLTAVTLGIESMSDETLQLFRKGTTEKINEEAVQLLEELNIYIEITFIFFHPLISLQEIRKNLQFIERIRQSKFAYFNRNMPFTEFIPFFNTEYTYRLEELKLVERTINCFSIRYLDPRVEMLVQKLRSIPLEQLYRLNHLLQTNNPHLKSILQSLLEYETYLNLVRLPELVSDFCDLFARNTPDNKRLEMLLHEFDRETMKIQSLFNLVIEVKEH
ncbi:MAG TPA: radical SAM protein, partial [Candidatus Methanoperedens sp.]